MPTYFVECFIIIVVIIITLIRRVGDSGKSVWVEDFSGLFKKMLYYPVELVEEKDVGKRERERTNEMCTRERERMTVNKLNRKSTDFIVIQLSSKFHRTKHYLELEQQVIFSDKNLEALS